MRRFEYVEGSSSKFWEIGREGATVTVRFGRIGTNGHQQVKDLGSDAAAIAHFDKLIAEKAKKGYTEADGAGPAHAAPAPVAVTEPEPAPAPAVPAAAPTPDDLADEDSLVIPASWRRTAHPRRDRPPVPKPTFDQAVDDALRESIQKAVPGTVAVLRDQDTDPELVAAAQQEDTPLGAGVVVAVLGRVASWRFKDDLGYMVDEWIEEHGLEFAVRAVAEAAGLHVPRAGHRTATYVRRITDADSYDGWWPRGNGTVARRLRAHLAALPDDAEYARMVAVMGEYRGGSLHQRLVTSYVAPTEQDWVRADLAAVAARGALDVTELAALAASESAQVDLIVANGPSPILRIPGAMHTIAIALGTPFAPLAATWFDNQYLDADDKKQLLDILATLPTDEAFDLLLDRVDQKYVQPALIEAARRFPVRALRLLAARPAKGAYADLLRAHVRGNAALVAAVRDRLPAEVVARADAFATAAELPEAPPDSLPTVLVNPPWTRKRAAAKPVVVDGLVPPDGVGMRWAPGERDEWARRIGALWGPRLTWEEQVERFHADRLEHTAEARLLLQGPDHLVRPLIRGWRPGDIHGASWARAIAAKYETEAFWPLLDSAQRSPSSTADVLLPYFASVVAELMAEWTVRLKSVRPVADKWFVRHGADAARALIPPAVGKAGADRRNAEAALRRMVFLGQENVVRAAAASYGPEAAGAIDALLTADPLEILPAKVPSVPSWLDVAILPQVLVRDRTSALPAASVPHLISMLALTKPGEAYAGLEQVSAVTDPASLAEFGWQVFGRWAASGFPSKDGWVLESLGVVGDDETVRKLSPLIRAWPGEGGHKRAVTGLDVLTAIGTDVALMHLYGIAQKVKFKGLKDQANEKIDDIAADLGLSAEQLADRLVPDLGLDADGTMTLDYGPRTFLVGFDEALKPFVTEDGQRRASLPRPGAKDDAEKAPAAYERFAALKKDVRTIATDQIRRLEQAMVNQRRWSVDEFRKFFVDHPLLVHIVRRLVWATYDGSTATGFRVAEDRSFASVEDDEITLADGASVGLAHPLHLHELAAWAEVFADYEILQPFAQLGRETFALTPDDAQRTELTAFAGRKVKTVKVLSMEQRGWRRGMPQDAGIQSWIYRDLPGGQRSFTVSLDPGIIPGMANEPGFEEQTLQEAFIAAEQGGGWGRQKNSIRLGELDAVLASEIIRDLVWLTS